MGVISDALRLKYTIPAAANTPPSFEHEEECSNMNELTAHLDSATYTLQQMIEQLCDESYLPLPIEIEDEFGSLDSDYVQACYGDLLEEVAAVKERLENAKLNLELELELELEKGEREEEEEDD